MTPSYDIIIRVPTRHDNTSGRPLYPSRADVLAAAEALLEQHGAEGLSMRRIAAGLGTSYQVVYSRIGGKPQLVRALHAEGFRRLAEAVEDLTADPRTNDYLVEMGQGYLRAAAAHPELFDVMFGTPVAEFARDATAKRVEWEGFERSWVKGCRIWLDTHVDPRPRGASVRLAWRLWTAVHGITVLHLAGHDSPSGDVDAEIDSVIRLLLTKPLA